MGLISPTLPTIGQLNATEDADLLDALQTIVNEINGNIDSSNFGTLDDLTFGAGAVLTWASDTNLYRLAANQLASDDDLIARATGARVFIGEAGPSGQSGIALGAASDVNVYRADVDVLGTDDNILAANGWMLAHVAESRQVISGRVAANGSIVSGEGFTITKGGAGIYTINFTVPFGIAPAVSVNAAYPALEPVHISADPAASTCGLVARGFSGGEINVAFSFVAVGAV
jgi:hypothetical protein